MPAKSTSQPATTVIIGGGIAGLSAAWELQRAGRPFLLLEAAPRCGGVIATRSRDGFLAEAGPESFLAFKPAAAELCRELGLEDELIPPLPNPAGAQVWIEGRYVPLPGGWRLLHPTQLEPLQTSPLFSAGTRAAFAARWVDTGAPPADDESVAAYLRRRWGSEAGQEIADRIVGPLLAGVYGGDIEQLSAAAAAPPPGAGAAAPPAGPMFLTLRDGMSLLVEALLRQLPADAIRCTQPVTALEEDAGGYRIRLGSGECLRAVAVILAVPAFHAATMLRGLDAALAKTLAAIPYASSVNINCAFRSAPSLPPGHGFLAVGAAPLLACTFAHQKFAGRAPAVAALLRLFYGDATADWADERLLEQARHDLAACCAITRAPDWFELRRCPRALPQYTVGHARRQAAITQALSRHAGLGLAGGAYQGVGMPDCIASGRAAAQRVLLTAGAGGS
ncbi:MAG TPA: protoporphyrinogen oxidase [Terriglobales bacterium]|nr:protoporphyrinogen oxidase [Terriglobales bacterium]